MKRKSTVVTLGVKLTAAVAVAIVLVVLVASSWSSSKETTSLVRSSSSSRRDVGVEIDEVNGVRVNSGGQPHVDLPRLGFAMAGGGGKSGVCPIPSKTYEPLRSFQFWGKTMNTSSPCPTAGLNNQLTMVMGLIHCSLGNQNKDGIFRFKDITCSPTGGKEGRRQFRIGSEDYEYQWFRWSELFAISQPAPDRTICLADEHSWSEHAWMKKCPTFVDHIYGTAAFWEMRRSLKLHEWFNRFSIQLLRDASKQRHREVGDNNDNEDADGAPTPPFVAIHVRRGDYENFCRQTAKSSGVRKFRTAPFVWTQRASEKQLAEIGLASRPSLLSSKFMTSCFPSTEHIVLSIGKLCVAHPSLKFVFVATNSKTFLKELRTAMAASAEACVQALPVVTLADYMDSQREAGLAAKHHGYWGRRMWGSGDGGVANSNGDGVVDGATAAIAPAVITDTELSLLDVNIMSFASVMVLNKYSTFSQSAIDFRVVRDGSLKNTHIYWW